MVAGVQKQLAALATFDESALDGPLEPEVDQAAGQQEPTMMSKTARHFFLHGDASQGLQKWKVSPVMQPQHPTGAVPGLHVIHPLYRDIAACIGPNGLQ